MFTYLQMPGKASREYYGYGKTELFMFRLAGLVCLLPLTTMVIGAGVDLAGQSWGLDVVAFFVNNFGGMMFFVFVAPALIRSLATHPFGVNRHVPRALGDYKWFAILIWALALAGMAVSLVFVSLTAIERQTDGTSIKWFSEALFSLSAALPYFIAVSIQTPANEREIDAKVRGRGGQ